MPGGRPSLYDDSYVQALLDYMEAPVNEEFPTIAGFACTVKPCRDTLHEWSKAKDGEGNLKYPQFSDAYKKVKDIQEVNIVQGALSGKYNPTFSIFFMKNNLGWKDKVEQEISGPDGGPIQTQPITFEGVGPSKD
jgi:hypothetical protein